MFNGIPGVILPFDHVVCMSSLFIDNYVFKSNKQVEGIFSLIRDHSYEK